MICQIYQRKSVTQGSTDLIVNLPVIRLLFETLLDRSNHETRG